MNWQMYLPIPMEESCVPATADRMVVRLVNRLPRSTLICLPQDEKYLLKFHNRTCRSSSMYNAAIMLSEVSGQPAAPVPFRKGSILYKIN
jgi:hypothetical protein